jgi:hypothetical protein
MNNTTFRRSLAARTLLATALVAAAWGAQAASGYSISHEQEGLIKVGMSQSEVREALGRPETMQKFNNEPGPTWTYEVVGAYDPAVFYVDYDADGKVASVAEWILPDHD